MALNVAELGVFGGGGFSDELTDRFGDGAHLPINLVQPPEISIGGGYYEYPRAGALTGSKLIILAEVGFGAVKAAVGPEDDGCDDVDDEKENDGCNDSDSGSGWTA